ncbi:hypothetical protein PtrV1_07217 [Pyrenophora tritici-repentis]|uniref:Uncharacterized protein n=1 Tax=Pyrenophora tritici-repentis TaxID=45151 RepID=A0A2W1E0H3_9PLEO|nr:hypothetical protein PtrV1_07217 [Pyrenophora tritici-repentis]KAI1517124.1 hypothetical protein Ptr86124_004061 [Pyrenophora tritici-repentis]KAI1602178.1 hypothetical protein PtrEW13061_000200 [Pyrenophora tritici-repentis]KAI1681941.1 hypothetical protein KJE20_08812 [Pyrenophora tritici-repentis]
MDQIRDTFYSEKISIHPDLGDLRKSTDKALPAPPVTPKRVLMKYRFSAIFPIAFSVTSFLLMLVLVLAGKESATFGGQYLLALDTSVLMQRAQTQQPNAMPVTPSARAAPEAVVPDIYYLYLQNICSGYTDTTTNSIIIANCESYNYANNRISAYLASTSATSSASTPSLTLLTSALKTLSTSLSTTRHVLTAFLLIALASTALSALSALPAIVFPHSPLLAYCNILWPCLGRSGIDGVVRIGVWLAEYDLLDVDLVG